MRTTGVFFLVIAVLIPLTSDLTARTVQRVLADKGKPISKQVAEHHDWPAGTLELVNHPLRLKAWKIVRGTTAGDKTSFAFTPRTPEQVQTVLDLYARTVAADGGWVRINARPHPAKSFTTPLGPDLGVAIILNMGSQKLVDDWFHRLPKTGDGKRAYKNRVMDHPPGVLPTTLEIYGANKGVDLTKLVLPKNLAFVVAVTKEEREANPDDPRIKAVDQFAAKFAKQAEPVKKKLTEKALSRRRPTPKP